MKKLEAVKTVAALVVSVGAGAIVGNLIKSTTPKDVKKIMKILITVSGFVLSSIASDKAAEYTENKIDDAVNTVKDFVKNDPKTTNEEAE